MGPCETQPSSQSSVPSFRASPRDRTPPRQPQLPAPGKPVGDVDRLPTSDLARPAHSPQQIHQTTLISRLALPGSRSPPTSSVGDLSSYETMTKYPCQTATSQQTHRADSRRVAVLVHLSRSVSQSHRYFATQKGAPKFTWYPFACIDDPLARTSTAYSIAPCHNGNRLLPSRVMLTTRGLFSAQFT